MTRSLYFIIPGSPNAAFFSQIAMFDLAIRRRAWRLFEPRVIAVFGGRPNETSYQPWRQHLRYVDQVFLPDDGSDQGDYMRQVDWRFRAAPAGAGVVVFCDADTLVIGDIETVAEGVIEDRGVAGVIAHYHFPGDTQTPVRQQWNRISQALIGRMLAFPYLYSLVRDDAPIERRAAPFYLNFGAVLVAGSVLDRVSCRYLELRPKVSAMTDGSYMAAQIALALALEAEGIPKRALGMAYNFPNDPIADKRYPDELSDVRILHYLRGGRFQRGRIFANPQDFAHFLALELEGSNGVLQSSVRALTSGTYPFSGID